ncbi:MAG: TIGR00730 family Rossman fold protein [Rhodospirillaceae bacterium]|jgi:uncharacterized protein (TIGR00730 family)|nr:TIGR00730 family Rossman fold protein [Rhodospirillaceae bacterium]MBT5191961.1 TIGR00730 family Rossman fold protein [Rhodospirillaceae bacterium]MBT5894929.1 TIGR00730 family Rossman fold protein [Rhodospirillaceae bacterium]MBT6430688.1 TIGR00730 family Rossman fold protein [Rhodospirillaceae bacterium]MBT7759269.1 TIGR00730 family Rossman fold protein [Rhodospirillaceae bacterium]
MPDEPFHPVKAYRDEAFLNSREARPLRILAEYMEPEERFRQEQVRDTIVMFGSARIPSAEAAKKALKIAKDGGGDLAKAEKGMNMSRYYEEARELAHRLTTWSKSLDREHRRFVICTGGGPGIMEAASRGASEAKGLNIGLNISLKFEQFANPYVTRNLAFEFHYFFTRKFWFAYLAKAIIAMPGGVGTLDELFETLTLMQTGKIRKKVPIVLYGKEFWDRVVDFQALVDFGTINAEDLDLFYRADSVDDAFEYLTSELTAHHLSDLDPYM